MIHTIFRPMTLAALLAFGAIMPYAAAAQAVAVLETDAFVTTVASSNAFEIQSSELALERAITPEVEDFAARMVADHTKAAAELQAAAGAPPPEALAAKHADMLARLQSAEDANFETLYLDMQADAHTEAVTLFSTFVSGGEDGPVREFAAATLPVLKMHKTHIDALVAR